MNSNFPAPVPEVPVSNVNHAVTYYRDQLGFHLDWVGEADYGIAGISKGECRLFLTSPSFRLMYGNGGPVLIWFNLSSRQEVQDLYDTWQANGASLVSPPEAKPWRLYEFTATDLDGNLMRVFYDFTSEPRVDFTSAAPQPATPL